MRRWGIIWLALIMLGCGRPPGTVTNEPVTPTDVTPAMPPTTAPPTAESSRLTQEQLIRMFSTTWIAHDVLTRESPLNADVDQKVLSDAAWLFAIQKAYRLTFYDAGPTITTRDDDEIKMDLPALSDEFSKTFRWIDQHHIAMENSGHWLIFRAADADD